MNRLQDKIIIVTGGGSGQGAAEARLFAEEGAQVVLTDRNCDNGQSVADQIGSAVLFMKQDVADESEWAILVDSIVKKFGRIDVLVNNAGVYRPSRIQETDTELFDFHYRINVLGTYLGMQAVLPVMLAQGQGSIINISSVAGTRGAPGAFAYSSTKWMIRGMSKCAAVDLAASNIRVNTIIPGIIDTPMLAANGPEYVEFLNNLIPAKRMGTAAEVAQAALYLASDEARYVMGAELSVCGGASA
jgi:3alpha(or 20beta)-hydroxysteroid dehydrogenase